MASPLSPDAIKSAVNEVLSNAVDLPEGHDGAAVAILNTDRVEVAIVKRVNDNWHVEAVVAHTWDGDNQVGVISSWKW